jgi:hypothetical protein
MLGDELLGRPAILMAVAVAVGAYGRDVAAVLEERERYLPSLAGVLIHGGRIASQP